MTVGLVGFGIVYTLFALLFARWFLRTANERREEWIERYGVEAHRLWLRLCVLNAIVWPWTIVEMFVQIRRESNAHKYAAALRRSGIDPSEAIKMTERWAYEPLSRIVFYPIGLAVTAAWKRIRSFVNVDVAVWYIIWRERIRDLFLIVLVCDLRVRCAEFCRVRNPCRRDARWSPTDYRRDRKGARRRLPMPTFCSVHGPERGEMNGWIDCGTWHRAPTWVRDPRRRRAFIQPVIQPNHSIARRPLPPHR